MTFHKAIAVLLLAMVSATLFALIFGASRLGHLLPGGLPLGNAVSALALCSAAGAAFALSQPRSALRTASTFALIGAVVWLPISIALAGNLALNFNGWRGTVWLGLTVAVLILSLVSLLWAVVASIVRLCRCAGAA